MFRLFWLSVGSTSLGLMVFLVGMFGTRYEFLQFGFWFLIAGTLGLSFFEWIPVRRGTTLTFRRKEIMENEDAQWLDSTERPEEEARDDL